MKCVVILCLFLSCGCIGMNFTSRRTEKESHTTPKGHLITSWTETHFFDNGTWYYSTDCDLVSGRTVTNTPWFMKNFQ